MVNVSDLNDVFNLVKIKGTILVSPIFWILAKQL